jgi:hypothetical protein
MKIQEYVNILADDGDLLLSPSFSWSQALDQKGYVGIRQNYKNKRNYPDVIEWMRLEIGTEHYVIIGGYWWFENKSDAMLFKLVWG